MDDEPKRSLLDPASRILVISHVLTGIAHSLGDGGQFQNRTDLGLRLLLVILPVDGVQVVRTLIGYGLSGFETFVDIGLLLFEIVAICRIGVEFIPWRVVDWVKLGFFMRIGLFPIEERAVTGSGIERLSIRVILHVLNKRPLLFGLLRSKRFRIL